MTAPMEVYGRSPAFGASHSHRAASLADRGLRVRESENRQGPVGPLASLAARRPSRPTGRPGQFIVTVQSQCLTSPATVKGSARAIGPTPGRARLGPVWLEP
jgi:hypothetical protein